MVKQYPLASLLSLAAMAIFCVLSSNGMANELADDDYQPGIDVSHHQNEIDWRAVKKQGVVFAFAKATEGNTYTDDLFQINWQAMKAAGIIRGAFIFYHDADQPQTQLDKFASVVSLEAGDLPPVVDVETESDSFPARDVRIADLHTFLNDLENHYGIRPIIYTSSKFWNKFYDDSFSAYPLWVAEYGVEQPSLPDGWDDWLFWQHSQTGQVSGITGDVDLDYFQGSLAQLKALSMK